MAVLVDRKTFGSMPTLSIQHCQKTQKVVFFNLYIWLVRRFNNQNFLYCGLEVRILFITESYLFIADFFALKIWLFSDDQRWISDVQRGFQVIYSAESKFQQRWSSMINSDSELTSAEILWDFNPSTLL